MNNGKTTIKRGLLYAGLVITLVLLSRCSTGVRTVPPKVYTDTLPYTEMNFNRISIRGLDPVCNESILSVHNCYWFLYVDTARRLCLSSIDSSTATVHRFDISNTDKDIRHFSMDWQDSILYINNYPKAEMQKYILHADYRLTYIETIDYSTCFKDKSYAFYNDGDAFRVIGDKCFFQISGKSKRDNYTDEYLYLVFEPQSRTFYKVFLSPDEYAEGLRDSRNTFLLSMEDHVQLCFFENIDRALVYDLRRKEPVRSIDFNPYANYQVYDKSQEKDLGYMRQYAMTEENNARIFRCKEHIVIIKRVKRSSMLDPFVFEYLVLDKHLKMVRYNRINHPINPNLSYPYREGFMLTDRNLGKGYYYEIH
jgi:hypothetical protein